jgi:thiamine-phosphate pyrophosphorylase
LSRPTKKNNRPAGNHALNKKTGINRIIDANTNRAKEGLRVCEEIARFILENRSLTSRLKKLRHKIGHLAITFKPQAMLLEERDSTTDTGKNIYANELNRRGVRDIFFANIQRVKESLRVLEEFSKLSDPKTAVSFKEIRYQAYELEKKFSQLIPQKKLK